jgi:hypothetical protein
MSIRVLAVGAAALISGLMAGDAIALPGSALGSQEERSALIVPVQLVCNESRCIDPRTGAYTYSNCNYRRGCYPSSGIVGYTTPPAGRYYRRRPYEGGPYDDPRPRRRWHPGYEEY